MCYRSVLKISHEINVYIIYYKYPFNHIMIVYILCIYMACCSFKDYKICSIENPYSYNNNYYSHYYLDI